MIDHKMFRTKIKFPTQKNCTESFIISKFLLAQTPMNLRNSNFFQASVQIFEIHIIWKIFSKYMDSVTSTGWEKKSLVHAFIVF